MTAVFKISNKRSKHKIKLFPINQEPYESFCFSSLDSINQKENLNYINEFIYEDETDFFFSTCRKIKKFDKQDIFKINTDQDGNHPNIHTIGDNKIFFNCSGIAPSDFIDNLLKIKKKDKISEFLIKDNTFAVYLLPYTNIQKKKFKFTDIDEFIKDRINKNKLLKFKVPNGKYIINTYWVQDVFGEVELSTDIVGHLIELK